jgi:hypothetical protein
MANSTLAGGNEPMGYSQASRIIATQDEVAQSYAEDFMRKKAQSLADQYSGQRMNVESTKAGLNDKRAEFAEKSASLTHDQNKQEVMAKCEEIKGVPELAPLEDLSQVPDAMQTARQQLEHEGREHKEVIGNQQAKTKDEINEKKEKTEDGILRSNHEEIFFDKTLDPR